MVSGPDELTNSVCSGSHQIPAPSSGLLLLPLPFASVDLFQLLPRALIRNDFGEGCKSVGQTSPGWLSHNAGP